MTIPSQPDIELPLLLELERLGGRVRKGKELYSRIALHFPDLTEEDLRLTRKSGVGVWENTVDWARNKLRVKGELDGGEPGIWEVTDSGKRRVRSELIETFGLSKLAVENFINSSQTFPELLGQRWQPRALQIRQPGVIPKPPPPVVLPPVKPPPDISSQLLTHLLNLTPSQFEHLVAMFLEANGFDKVRVTGRSHDGGIDGDCIVPFVDVKIAFQAKRFKPEHAVGTQLMQQFKGSIGAYERGVFITTSCFTPGAKEIAEGPGVKIILIDGQALVENMIQKELGIKTVPITSKEIDEGFFRNLSV